MKKKRKKKNKFIFKTKKNYKMQKKTTNIEKKKIQKNRVLTVFFVFVCSNADTKTQLFVFYFFKHSTYTLLMFLNTLFWKSFLLQ